MRTHALYIVDSGSTDDTAACIQAHPPERCTFLQNAENIGFAAGTNQGIRAALQDGCAAILALNNDVVFGPELLERLAGALDQYHRDMTTPIMYFYEPKDRHRPLAAACNPGSATATSIAVEARQTMGNTMFPAASPLLLCVVS